MADNNDNPTMKQALTKAITEPSEKTFLIGFFLITYVLLFPLRLSTFFPDNARLAIYVVLAIDGIVAYRLVLLTATKQVWETKIRSIIVVCAGFLGMNILTTITGFLLKIFGFITETSQNETRVAELGNGNALPFLVVLGVGVAGPIVEELVFRQFLIGFLERYIPTWAAIAISSLSFGLIHMHGFTASEWVNLCVYSAMGLSFSLIYALDRNVYMPIGVHVWNNLPNALLLAQ